MILLIAYVHVYNIGLIDTQIINMNLVRNPAIILAIYI